MEAFNGKAVALVRRKESLLALVPLESATISQLKLPKLIGNGMFLQRYAGVKIWGWASESEIKKACRRLLFEQANYTE